MPKRAAGTDPILSPWPGSAVLWIVGTLLLLAPPLIRWVAWPVPISVPRTPVDHVNGLYARQWALIEAARGIIPPGQTYTAIARDKEDEMLLFMLSLGLLADRAPMPSSYWKGPVAEGGRARYVLSYECFEPPGGARLVRRFPEGCVWERAGLAR
jgi:hypothetical protein